MAVQTIPWDVSKYLQSEEDQIAYLEAAFEDGDEELLAAVVGDIARARGIAQVAQETGLTRAALYKSFRRGGNPTLSTVTKVLKALGLKLSVSAA